MALHNAQFTLNPGEIHALLGENGTGKSTLMHILAGYFPPSSGCILLDKKEMRFSSPSDALANGIGMVRQHPGFVNGFLVWENCILGSEKRHRKGPFFNPAHARKYVEEKAKQWQFDLPLDDQAESLTVSRRQMAAVLALLLRDVNWFIFDEPTAVLPPEEAKKLFELINRLRKEGRGIILITHKLEEALAVSDRVTVIRHGITQGSRKTGEISLADIRSEIFGGTDDITCCMAASKSSFPLSEAAQRQNEESEILVIKNLFFEPPGLPPLKNVNLRLMQGSIVGIAGGRDAGLETLEFAVTGLFTRHEGSHDLNHNKGNFRFEGSIALNGIDITGKGKRALRVKAFRDAGGAYLGADRLGSNLAPELPLCESLVIHASHRERTGIFLNMGRLNSWCRKIMDMAGIPRSVRDRPSSFSGGMLQRILLAREFAEGASLLVLTEAGSGLDQINRVRLADELKALAASGTAILLFSTDAEELVSFAGEIMMLRNGTLTEWEGREWGNNEAG